MNAARTKRSRSEHVADYYRALIADGQFRPGEVLPSENALAKRFEVSRVTVRKGLELLHQEKLIQPIQGYGWVFGSGAAPSGGSGRTCAGFLYPSELDGHESVERVFAGFMREAEKEGLFFEKLMLPRFSDTPFSELPISRRLLRGELCGVVVHGAFPRDYLLWMLKHEVPVIQIGSLLGASLPIPQVCYDLVQIYFEAVRMLLHHACRKPAIPLVRTTDHNEALIYGGVLSAQKAAGQPMDLSVVVPIEDYGAEEGQRLARRWLESGEVPDGVVAADEAMGIAMAQEFKRAKQQVRVVLVGNFLKQPGFDAVELDALTLGSEACSLLCQRLRERVSKPLLHYIPITLVQNPKSRKR